jgi:hypothetical protein
MMPAEVMAELSRLSQNLQGASDALFKAEESLAEAEHALDLVEQKAFIAAVGTVADRQALARLEAADSRLERDLRKAEVNRIKTKLKTLESALMATATMAKIMEMETRI